MKYFITAISLIIGISLFGQIKDTRAELDVKGRIKEVSVAPNGTIWLVTAMTEAYYTESIDANWHYSKPLPTERKEFSSVSSHLERVSFFNNDTAIITGYIYGLNGDNLTNGYYRTEDAGKTWRLLNYSGNSWIYTIQVDSNGNAWMGGSSKELYYSADYGKTWTTIEMPYKSCDRTYGLFMSDSNNGVASSDDNEIMTTSDNWKTVKHIETPIDQENFEKSITGYSEERISKIVIWRDKFVVNQRGEFYYSDTKDVSWKEFPIKIVDFGLDRESQELIIVRDDFAIVSMSSITDYRSISKNRLSDHPIDIKVVNNAVYSITAGYQVYKIDSNSFKHSIPYSTDRTIEDPTLIRKGTTVTWGIDGNQVYLFDKKGSFWYREKALDFTVYSFRLLNDSSVVLWDGHKNNYLYSLNTHDAKLYFPTNPLSEFLKYPIQELLINAGSYGCYHNSFSEVSYTSINDSTLKVSTVQERSNQKKKSSKFRNTISSLELNETLSSIDSNPSYIPRVSEFEITKEDKQNYLTLVDKRVEPTQVGPFDDDRITDKEFYYQVVTMLDTISTQTIERVLDQPENIWSTTSMWFKVQVVNTNNDTLLIRKNYFAFGSPWNLPWLIKYDDEYFNCYCVELSKYIAKSLPKDFRNKELFDNKLFIMKIAEYLYEHNK